MYISATSPSRAPIADPQKRKVPFWKLAPAVESEQTIQVMTEVKIS